MDAAWDKLLRGEPISLEVRLNKTFEAEEFQEGQRVSGPTWIIAAAYPEKDHAGRVVGVLGCLTDISRQKWAEGFQKRKMFEAIELKRQQENFIDITSHEMRNPLSAIIQCADLISTSLTEFDAGLKDLTIPREIVDSHIDAAQTIILCAQHQRRIIDDILTLSKLDSDLLLITPIEVQPVSVIESALKMFGADLQKADIQLRLRIEQSYVDLTVDWVKLDPSRMLQVFINLLTNAIKFTQPEPKREIAISIGASLDRPAVRHGVEYLPRGTARKDLSAGAAWGSGEEVYLYIEVQDSGRGLSDHERKLLFQRFAQASPRTHVQYGGSGLGLFISRELTELQGGQIGVASTAGVGSIFAFYVKGRRCSRPESSTSVAAHQINMRAQTKVISSAALARIQDGPNPPKIERQGSLPVLPPKHVLIVEDNIVNQRVLSKQLRNAGYIVSVANHGGEALTFLSTTRFWKGHETDGAELSLILMDLEMPTMDGLTCVKRIRQLQEEGTLVAHVPVIAVTANARSEQIATAKTSGMDSVVTKPFRVPELIPEMDKLMRKGIEKPDAVDRSASAPP
jgi:signal transduction histidine kinase/DNA-binding NarL/FixJ family response regulator